MVPTSYITGKSMNTITLYSLLKLHTHTHTHTHNHFVLPAKAADTHTHTHTHTEEAKLFLVISLKEMCKRIPEVMHKYVHNNLNQKHFTGQ